MTHWCAAYAPTDAVCCRRRSVGGRVRTCQEPGRAAARASTLVHSARLCYYGLYRSSYLANLTLTYDFSFQSPADTHAESQVQMPVG